LSTEFGPNGDFEAQFAAAWGFPFSGNQGPWWEDIKTIFSALKVVDSWNSKIYGVIANSAGALGAGGGKR